MIAVSESPRNSMVCLFKTLKGYKGGNVEPFNWNSTQGGTCDDSLKALGYRRVEDWQPVEGKPWAGVVFAKIERIEA